MSLRTPTFLDALRDGPLLDPPQRAELTRDLQHRFPEQKALARELLQRGWLTPYQVNQLFLGRGEELLLGSYVLLERLGEGGTGQVFKARHQKMARIVALKIIRPELLTDAEVVQRFYREVRVLSQLAHANVVHAYDAGPLGAGHVLVMEYVEGTDLSQRVKRDGPLAVTPACEYIRQAALGLQHVHEHGLVHRDVKPSNLLVTRSGGKELIKLLDLGLARLRRVSDGEITSTLTPVGSVTMGTPDYLAPEQALDFHQVDIRADVYSLGCTFYFLLTGQPPFPGGSMAQKLLRHQQAAPPPLERFRSDAPPILDAVIQRMMAKRPEERYQTPGEVADAVASAVGLGPMAVLLPDVDDRTVPMAVPLIGQPARSRRPRLLLSGAAMLLLVGGFGLFRWLGSASNSGVIAEAAPTNSDRRSETRPDQKPPSPTARLRELIRPDADESPWASLPWAPTLWEGRQRAAQQGRPILLWETDGPPLGCTSTDGIASRALIFTDPEVLRLARNEFVPVGGDDWYQRSRRDSEGDFFRRVADQRNPKPREGRQGYYCLTAEGRLLAYHGYNHDAVKMQAFLKLALGEWQKLPEEQRKPGALSIGPAPVVDANRHRAAPPGTRIAAVYTRILERDGRGDWRRGNSPVPGADRAGRDFLWILPVEGQDIAAAAQRPGAQFPLPRKLAERLVRYHLVDNTRGEPTFWTREEVRSLQLTVTVGEVTAERVQMTLEGNVLLATQFDPAKAERGYEAHLTGQLAYDLKRRTWTRFELVAVGDHWGEGPYTPGARPGRAPLGVAIELVEESAVGTPLPGAARGLSEYLSP